ncbi:MAG: chemotaxis protein CheA [Gammaproteobacteria bacterium]|nr:chemotaxis protein CheA [Gammaproteobacteria bacterium]
MAIDVDDEILQDFLIEAGEILEQLNEQLLDLEQRPDDYDLLNAAFRGFHTIKGGAGFLGIDPLVNVCHRAEDVFNVLRQGQRKVDAGLMDTMLNVLDIVNGMFEAVRAGEVPAEADPQLLESLNGLAKPGMTEPAPEAVPKASEAPEPIACNEAQVPGPVEDSVAPEAAPQESAAESDEITEDEFEALLDQLHGPGKHSALPPKGESVVDSASDEITEAEFEKLLDELHGPGKHTGVPKQAAANGNERLIAPAPDNVASPTVPDVEAATPVVASTSRAEVERPASGATSSPTAESRESGKMPQKTDTTVRVDTARLDEIMNMVGELVLVRNRLATLKSRLGDEEVATAVANLDLVTADLQNSVMKTRMQPIKKVFGRFPRVVRDLARSLKKEINLEMYGEDTDLDKNLVEALADPMVHLVRNAVDHGIETPTERKEAGKPEQGRVVLSAAQEGDHILLSIADDGRGMDADVLRLKAVEKGMMDQESAQRLDKRDCYNLIFQPGFSTKTQISDVSGRGVGMDVVKTRITQMNGSVEIDSELGVGSTITIKLPLTLAILPTLMVVLGNQSFALPLSSVVEIFNLDLRRTNVVDGQLTIMVRERALPLFYLREWLIDQSRSGGQGNGHVVVVNVGGKQVCLVVDYLIGQEEVVIKPLGALLQGLDGMAGATITGDGKIALILDVPGLMRKYVRRR